LSQDCRYDFNGDVVDRRQVLFFNAFHHAQVDDLLLPVGVKAIENVRVVI
jgi:hypothetical protein